MESFAVELREGEVFVGLPAEETRVRTVSDRMVDTMIEWGVEVVFGMVGHSNLGLADAIRVAAEGGRLRSFGIRHEGAPRSRPARTRSSPAIPPRVWRSPDRAQRIS